MVDEAEQRRRQARGRARLRALGIDVDQMSHEQIREAYEGYRSAYIDIAEQGRHLEPLHIEGDPLTGATAHARWGMLTAALADALGGHPEAWSPPQIKWPTHHERAAGKRGQ